MAAKPSVEITLAEDVLLLGRAAATELGWSLSEWLEYGARNLLRGPGLIALAESTEPELREQLDRAHAALRILLDA